MIAKELNIEYKKKSQEEIARKVIEVTMEEIEDRKEKLKFAEAKLAEFLEKDINEIKEEDGHTYSWDD